jgi:hypothetical protein
VSLLGLAFCHMWQSPLFTIIIPVQGLRRTSSVPWEVSLFDFVARREAHRVYDERLRSERRRRRVEGDIELACLQVTMRMGHCLGLWLRSAETCCFCSRFI